MQFTYCIKVLYLARKTCKDLHVNENQAQHNPGFLAGANEVAMHDKR